jgi:DNA-binding response OmpR family regulator
MNGKILLVDDEQEIADLIEVFLQNEQYVPAYLSIKVPMLAICGSGEVKDMKLSLDMLGKNACCQTMILSKAGHDFPMRNSKGLNAVLNDFLLGKIKEN